MTEIMGIKPNQQRHWDEVFAKNPEFFGKRPSYFAQRSLDVLQRTGVRSLLELGCGQGRDIKKPLPFPDNSFDACYSHMLLCMELTTAEMEFLLLETHRILKPGGLMLYSVRNSFDKQYQSGTHLSEEMYEIGGFVIHFFSEEKVRDLATGYEILKIDRMEEGSLPRDLFVVSLKKLAGALSNNDQDGGLLRA